MTDRLNGAKPPNAATLDAARIVAATSARTARDVAERLAQAQADGNERLAALLSGVTDVLGRLPDAQAGLAEAVTASLAAGHADLADRLLTGLAAAVADLDARGRAADARLAAEVVAETMGGSFLEAVRSGLDRLTINSTIRQEAQEAPTVNNEVHNVVDVSPFAEVANAVLAAVEARDIAPRIEVQAGAVDARLQVDEEQLGRSIGDGLGARLERTVVPALRELLAELRRPRTRTTTFRYDGNGRVSVSTTVERGPAA